MPSTPSKNFSIQVSGHAMICRAIPSLRLLGLLLCGVFSFCVVMFHVVSPVVRPSASVEEPELSSFVFIRVKQSVGRFQLGKT